MTDPKQFRRAGFWRKTRVEAGKEAIRVITAAFNKVGIPYFLDYGTLLGYIREGKFIRIDTDVDFGICAENYKPELVDALGEGTKGRVKTPVFFADRLRNTWYGPDDKDMWPVKLGVTVKDPGSADYVGCDIYFHYLSKGNLEGYRTLWSTRKKTPRYIMENLKTTTFYGTEVTIPENAEEYLEILYGKNWRIPAEITMPWRYFVGVKRGDTK